MGANFLAWPEGWRLLVDDQKHILGYWHALPLQEKYFSQVLSGKFSEADFAPAMLSPHSAGTYDWYLSEIVVAPELEHGGPTKMLLQSMRDAFRSLQYSGIMVGRFALNAYTPAGQHFAERAGMHPVIQHQQHGEVYAMEGSEFYTWITHL